jgi:hypothetical protein
MFSISSSLLHLANSRISRTEQHDCNLKLLVPLQKNITLKMDASNLGQKHIQVGLSNDNWLNFAVVVGIARTTLPPQRCML